MAEIRLAVSAGFCFGVKRALDTVYEALDKTPGRLYTYGPIIHNETVVAKLAKRGVAVLENLEALEQLTEGTVVIRSHGVGRAIYELIEKKGLKLIDATCPFVKKIHRLVAEHTAAGERVVIVGNPTHPEVEGIVGWAEGEVLVLPEPEFAEKMPDGEGENLFIVAQTTYNIGKFKLIIEILQKKGYYVNVINTICNATSERQTEARALAREVDTMLVIGSESSSNTKKLYEICKDECNRTQLIQSVRDIRFESVGELGIVGITAGASTPNDIIEEVLTYVRNEF